MTQSWTTGAWWSWLRRLTVKELRESLRDRRTTFTLLLMPVILYPLLSLAFQKFLIASVRSEGPARYRIGMLDENSGLALKELLTRPEAIRARREGPNSPAPIFEFFVTPNLGDSVTKLEIDLGIRLNATQSPSGSRRIETEISYCPNSARSEGARRFVEDTLRWVNESYLRQRLRELGESGAVPFGVQVVALKSRDGAQASLGALIPLILLLMTVTGAVYPAIDTTAGERERGTLEVLMASPVPRIPLLFAKFAAVWTVAVMTAAVNLLAMTVTLSLTGISTLLFGEHGLTPLLIVEVFGLMLLLAAFFSAALLALTSAARSFKEAQAYLIPLMIVALAPGLMSLSAELTLNSFSAVIPLLGDVLLTRDLFQGSVPWELALLVIVSTLVYAALSLWAAAQIFGTDAVLYGGESGWAELWNRPETARDGVSLAECGFCLLVMFPAYFAASQLLGRWADLGISSRLIASAVLTIALFALWPTAVAWWRRTRLIETFQCHRPPLVSLVTAVILGVTLWPVVLELVLWTESLGLVSFSAERISKFQTLIDQWRAQRLGVLLLCLAVVPAVCEEWFFRGMLLRALLQGRGKRQAIFLSGLLFGLFHLVVTDHLAIERLLPSALLGWVLGCVAVQSRSVLPGMLLHSLHNGLVLTLDRWLPKLGVSTAVEFSLETSHLADSHLPYWLTGVSLIALTAVILQTVAVVNRPQQ